MSNLFSVWSVALILIVCFFLFLTREEWRKKVGELKVRFKNKGVDASSGQEQSESDRPDEAKVLTAELDKLGIRSSRDFKKFVETVTEDLNKKDKEINIINEAFGTIYDFFEKYKFEFLNYFLVPNSKLALLWFHKGPSTKENFDMNFPLQLSPENIVAEKAAILNALLSHGLITLGENGQYSVTPHGVKFLQINGLI